MEFLSESLFLLSLKLFIALTLKNSQAQLPKNYRLLFIYLLFIFQKRPLEQGSECGKFGQFRAVD